MATFVWRTDMVLMLEIGEDGGMVDLRAYYLDKVEKGDYYAYFRPLIEEAGDAFDVFDDAWDGQDTFEFLVFDEEEAIAKFKELCQPENELNEAKEQCWFYLTAYFLNSRGYYIEQFPRVLERPPKNPVDFTYGEIRNWAFAHGMNDGSTIRYAVRRQIVADFSFKRKASSLAIGDELDQRIRVISTRNASFDELETDEKLEAIANLIENLLKRDGRFLSPGYDCVMLGYVTEQDIKRLRGQLQCFRHSHDIAIEERSGLTNQQKLFLVDYGVTVCKAIYLLVSDGC